jgi:7,8-dihydropterin-6-yl-methyl-4-(beta-D-ribofuranosyl)aminobenzene 5'-phosphate synthase
VKEGIYYSKPQEMAGHFYTSGELENIEQSSAIETKNGPAIIAGCSHQAIKSIFTALSQFGKIYGITGGMHGFDHYPLFEG